jgi:hypothetical protein
MMEAKSYSVGAAGAGVSAAGAGTGTGVYQPPSELEQWHPSVVSRLRASDLFNHGCR